jgi:L-2-hydroxyglutarate oxidase LhgO
MASKEDIKAVKEDVHALDKKVTEGFERIEKLLLATQEQRLNDLEARMKRLEDALAV